MATRKHSRLFRFVVLAICSCTILSYAMPGPLQDIPRETLSGSLSSGIYGWNYGYDISFQNLEIYVELRINLTGAHAGSTLLNTWQTGIENIWSLRFDIIDADFYHYHVNFDALLGYNLSNAHHAVRVLSGQGSGNMLNWYTTSAWGSAYNGAYVAHEVGHMIGLYDEYPGGAVNPYTPLIDFSSIMGSLDGEPKPRHYEQTFLGWLQGKAPDRYLEIGPYDPDWVIPEPATFAFLFAGILLVKRKPPQG